MVRMLARGTATLEQLAREGIVPTAKQLAQVDKKKAAMARQREDVQRTITTPGPKADFVATHGSMPFQMRKYSFACPFFCQCCQKNKKSKTTFVFEDGAVMCNVCRGFLFS